ncbi:MAG TPA: P-II family nitrogen regulator [Burkholderiales bacterium]|nr:P-II family nitrogen regulator [Betaproteobacteria bacterium]HQR51863.1 P-II family nitrogen regulator [Burkholderiales bacterium]
MKEIKAVVQPSRVPKIRRAFRHVKDFPGMTVIRVEGCSRSTDAERKSIREELTEFSPKVRIEIVAPDEMVEGILQVLVEVSSTGQRGDGIVWITDAERMIRIADHASSAPE